MEAHTFTHIIVALYEEVNVRPPSGKRRIVPLGDLAGSYNLTCTEVSGLTRASASRTLAMRGGVLEDELADQRERLAGFLYASPRHGSIFVEQADPVVRRRFSVAHELGHYLLHFRPLFASARDDDIPLLEAVDVFPAADSETEPDRMPTGQIDLPRNIQSVRTLPPLDQMEREANQFAAELLMPQSLIEELVAHYARHFRDEDLIWRLATELLVSRAAMRWRLRNLGILPPQSVRSN